MAGLVVTTPPSVEPVSLAEAKLHLKVDGTDDDTYITALIKAARRKVENETRRSLCTTTLTQYLDEFPRAEYFTLSRPPVASVSSVKYYDAEDVLQTLSASTVYELDGVSLPAAVWLRDGQVWPTTFAKQNAVVIDYVTGYGGAADVPEDLKQALLMILGSLYEQRQDATATAYHAVPLASAALISPYEVDLYA